MSMNETTQIHKSKETVLARNQNVVTGEQFKYFSYLIDLLFVCMYMYMYTWQSTHGDQRTTCGSGFSSSHHADPT